MESRRTGLGTRRTVQVRRPLPRGGAARGCRFRSARGHHRGRSLTPVGPAPRSASARLPRRCAGPCAPETFRCAGPAGGRDAPAGRRAPAPPSAGGRPASLARAGQNTGLAATRNAGPVRSVAGRDNLSHRQRCRGPRPPAPTDSGRLPDRPKPCRGGKPAVWRPDGPGPQRSSAGAGRPAGCPVAPGRGRRSVAAAAGAEACAAISAAPQEASGPDTRRPARGPSHRSFALDNPFFRLRFAYRNAISR